MRRLACLLLLTSPGCDGEPDQPEGVPGNEATLQAREDIPAEVAPEPLPAPVPIPTDEATEFYAERIADGVAWIEDAALLEVGFELLEGNVPSTIEGKGRRLGELPPGSLMGKLGFASRDLVLEVNGRSPVAAKDLRAATRIAVDGGRFVVELQRDGKPLTLEIHVLRQRRPSVEDRELQAFAVLRGGVRVLGDVRRLVDRKVIEALAEYGALRSDRLFEYLGLPEGASPESVGGDGIEDQGSAISTLAGVGEDVKAFDLSIRAPGGRLLLLQYEIGEGLLNAEDLERALGHLTRSRATLDRGELFPSDPQSSSRVIDGAAEAINCESDNVCTVDRAFWNKLSTEQLATQARIVPSQRDGETQGFKFYGIRRGSLPKLLGLKNGDMLTEVDGKKVTSVQAAVDAYTRVKRRKTIEVTIVRKGAEVTKTFTFK